MAFTSADSYNDKDWVKAWQSTFQFISTVCIERLFFFFFFFFFFSFPTTETRATPFFSLNSLFSEIISKSLSRSASPPGFWCHFHCNTSLMTDICFTWVQRWRRKKKKKKKKHQKTYTHYTHPFCFRRHLRLYANLFCQNNSRRN